MAEIILALRPPLPVADGRRASRHSNHRSGALFRRRRRGVAAAPASRERLSAPSIFRQSMPPDLDLEGGNRSSQGMRPIGDGRSEFQFDQNRIRRTRAAPDSAQPLPPMHRSAQPKRRRATAQSAAISCNQRGRSRRRQASDTAQQALGLATRVSYVRAVGARTRNQAQNNRAPTDPRGKLYLNGLITI